MKDLFPEIEINADEAESIARGLLVVARADGDIHQREAMLISEFFASIGDRACDLAALERSVAIEPATLAMALRSAELRQLFLMTALLLAYADGSYTEQEARSVGKFAAALDVSTEDLAGYEEQVKEFLLSQLAHLENVDATVAVAKELGL